jgi:hypothetical protein
MKRIVLGFAVLALALPAAAGAQVPSVPGTIELSVLGGPSVPMGDFSDFAATGYGIGVDGSYYVVPAFGVGANIIYNSYNAQDSAPSVDANMTIWEFTAHGKYTFMPGPISPYGKVALGWFRSGVEVGTETVSSSDMGVGAGVGAQWHPPTSNMGVFAEAMYNNIFTDGSSTNYVSFRAGVNFHISPTP